MKNLCTEYGDNGSEKNAYAQNSGLDRNLEFQAKVNTLLTSVNTIFILLANFPSTTERKIFFR